MGTAEYEAKKKTELAKKPRARHAKKWLRKHRQKILASMAEKIDPQSRQEAFSEMVPEVKQKQGKKKLSDAFRHSLKNKPCAKNKLSAKLKELKKAAKQTQELATQEEAIPGAGPKKTGEEQATEAPPPLPPPAEAPQEAPASDDPFLMQEAVVTSEAAGKLYFGKEGKLTFLSDKGFYTMATTSGVFQIKPEWLQLKSSKPLVARVEWPKWNQLSKNDLQLWLF